MSPPPFSPPPSGTAPHPQRRRMGRGGCSAFRPGHARGGHGDTADPTSRLPATPDDRLPAVPPAPHPHPRPADSVPLSPTPTRGSPRPTALPGAAGRHAAAAIHPHRPPRRRTDGEVPTAQRRRPQTTPPIPPPALGHPLPSTDAQTPLAPHARGRDGGDARPGRDATRGGLQSGQPGERSATPEGRAPAALRPTPAAPRRTPRHPLSDPRHLPSDPLTDPRHSPPVPRRPPPDLRRPSLTYAVPGSPGSGGEEQPQGEERGHRPPGSRTRPGVPERRLPNCDRPNRRSRCASHRRLLRR